VGIIRAIIPLEYQPSGRTMFFIANGLLPFFITLNTKCCPQSYRTLFETTQDADCEAYIYFYERKSVTLPPCWPRQHKSPNCLLDFRNDFFKRLILSFKFYIKFYGFLTLFNYRAFLNHPTDVTFDTVLRAIRSTFFLAGTFHFGERFHCLYRHFITWLYRDYYQIDDPLPTNTTLSRALFLLNSGFWGWFWIGFEAPGRHGDLSLFTFWKDAELGLRLLNDVKVDKEPGMDCILANPRLPQFFFASAIGMWTWLYYKSPATMKSVDRMIVQQFLI